MDTTFGCNTHTTLLEHLPADGLAADGLAADGLAADGLAADGLAAKGLIAEYPSAELIETIQIYEQALNTNHCIQFFLFHFMWYG